MYLWKTIVNKLICLYVLFVYFNGDIWHIYSESAFECFQFISNGQL